MAHELTQSDGLVLTRTGAWHGLGTIVEEAPSPAEALKLARLDWTVEQWPLIRVKDGDLTNRRAVTSHVANVRSDNGEQLAVVGEGYTPVQNAQLADIAAALAEGGDQVQIESAGSIRGGAKVWFLLRGESFSARKADTVTPYILLANGHDGGQSLRAIPTTVRVVCSNTLHMSLRAGDRRAAGYTFRHTAGISLKVEEIKQALGLYGKALDTTRQAIEVLAAREIDSDAAKAFFVEAYSRDFGAIPANPKNDTEKSARERALDAFTAYGQRFDRERVVAGATAWNAMNAYTGWLQHERPVRVAAERKAEARNDYRLLGEDADRTLATFNQALALTA